jgi:uncharacterized membrane protein (DUF2068 family)
MPLAERLACVLASPLAEKDALLGYYFRERLMSPAARARHGSSRTSRRCGYRGNGADVQNARMRDADTPHTASRATPPTRRDRGLALIAVFKFMKAALLIAVGLGAIDVGQASAAGAAHHSVAAALAAGVDRRLTQQLLAHVSGISPTRLEALGVGAFLYAALFGVEGLGLWRARRWAEYLTVIATASFIPVEVYEISQRVTATRLSALMLNVAMVAYLVHRLWRAR